MEIYKSKVMGFCYGVRRALKIAENAADSGIPAVTLGPIIHNPQVVGRLAEKGVPPADTIDEITDKTVIIRSHGVGPSCYNMLKCKNLALMDATCPFVRRNQILTKKLVDEGKQVILIGEKRHPEMISVAEWAVGHSYQVETMEDVDALPPMQEAHVVMQTTFSVPLADQLIAAIAKKVKDLHVNRSICDATRQRQQAARELAEKVDVMIVIGGKNSANTTRLAEICRSSGTTTHHIETAEELKPEWFSSRDKIGITAGASTPDWIIEEVVCIMENMKEMLDQEEMNLDVHKGSVVEGKVVDLYDDKAYISFGYKTEAVLLAHEYSFPAPASLKDVLQVGDSLRVQIVSGVKEDSTIYVSKIKVDRLADWDVVEEAFEKGESVECEGIEAIKVGLLVQLKSLRGFIPLSQGDLRFVHSLQGLVGQKFQAKILEVDRTKNRLVLSRKAVLEDERNAEMDEIEKAYENGDVLKGVVKKIMPYGAFVGINGVEGLLHISDISWKKIGKVEDVLKPEEEIDVKIKSFDREKQRISFSHKDCLPNPWETALENHHIDDEVEAKVVKILEFGVIVELDDGLTGLLHINEMTDDHNKKPGDICQVGDDLKVRIINIDEGRRRISFQLVEAPVHEAE
ncbi:bifunctional 4-hydroxy-3-methylbut-2-enyl diphosphate reductase/30S ribosomal protein S1 [Dialister sp.]|uniref:bifunctional 4-hydroxy-3-methylbut-2-enyl diphosphate reductase/30S ribosomal protein S1 n=1 Tax=Dialister sp. TaxID=1955814 RepID=UPI002E80BE12|nr:bifunctional 4-hydroxy-3-methylbut-2-enyl diphosphate reductase/30S ribosomal protein S1 [Dialister sp.]MEE3452663.1 bifunctional 4-hydroxy-3-methylbut-2-enyl diphosphate reductase/30S ribosomal protein S1 [Dialister sp.]